MRRMFTLGHIPAASGTHVQAHYRSAPDGNFDNNLSTLGNVNPYTGEPGTLTSQRTDTAEAAAADTFEDDGESDPDYDLDDHGPSAG